MKAKNAASYDDYQKLEFKFAPDCEYNLANNMVLNVPGYLREILFEKMFVDEEESYSQTIPILILKKILKCPIDLH